jgi:outer membrane receptor protein involved in Fe transport
MAQPVADDQGPAGTPDAAPLLARITVSAKGHRAADLDTPVSAVIVDREQILDRGAANVGDAIRGEPGLAVASDGAQGANPVIRGLKREGIVLQVDGMRLNSAQPAGAVASFMSLGLAERVEVIKGPASVLYGTGALGGVIDVQLPQAELGSGTEGRAQLRADSASRGWRGAGVVRMGNDQVATMAVVAALHADDYEAPDGRVDRTVYDSLSAIGQLRVPPGHRADAARVAAVAPGRRRRLPGFDPAPPQPAVGTTTVYSPEQRRELAELGWSFSADGAMPWSLDARLYRQQVARQIFSRGNALGGAPGHDIAQARVRSDSAVSGQLGVVREAAPGLRPYANLARGVRAGEMRERFEASPRADGFYYVGNPQIRPETANQLELGVKGERSRLQYQVAADVNRIDNYISPGAASSARPAATAAGTASAGLHNRREPSAPPP